MTLYPGMGIAEMSIVIIVVLLSLGVPVAIIVLLIRVYKKTQSIEEQLKREK